MTPDSVYPVLYGYQIGGSSPDAVSVALVGLGVVYLLFGVDDLFLDAIAILCRLAPEELGAAQMESLASRGERRIAIVVPAWHEGGIVRRMLVGNLERIEYRNYHFFVGVYPNDPDTCREVEELSRVWPNVHAVMNVRPGPTSKGQMLNEAVREVMRYEQRADVTFEALLMQDAEDVIHPKSLQLVNARLDEYDYLQLPVFSLSVARGRVVASTYMDEFAESHTKDLLVRQKLGAAIPSAGVGTALSRRLWTELLARFGSVFNEGSLTEDYELGVRSHALGFRPHFACCHFLAPDGKREFIATREFFPKTFRRSLRQKSRWTTGIAFQARRNLGWVGTARNRYFLYRDRKGPWANVAGFLGYPVLALATLHPSSLDVIQAVRVTEGLLFVNGFLMFNRCAQRMVCVQRVYGVGAALPVLLAWPVANTINALASLHALRNDVKAQLSRSEVRWAKTDHELPEFFGEAPKQKVNQA